MPGLADLPVELLLDNLLPALTIPDLLSLSQTSRFFASLGDDDTLWKRKLAQDFNFTGQGTARTSGWKFIYRGLRKPKVFVWGQNDNGRLGLPGLHDRDVPAPVELKIPGARIVALAAGGMSFHAIDSEGQVYVWGTLDGSSYSLQNDGYANPSKEAPKPMKLELPQPIRSINCGRLHATALAADLSVYSFLSWGLPFKVNSHLLDLSDPDSTPRQVESGWAYSAVLTESGNVLVWWPFLPPDDEPAEGQPEGSHIGIAHDLKMEEFDKKAREGDDRFKVKSKKNSSGVDSIPCILWDLRFDPLIIRPPPAADLPDFDPPVSKEWEDKWTRPSIDTVKNTNIVKIAALDNVLMALTDKGHVLRYRGLSNAENAQQGRWEYMPYFSELKKIKRHPTYSDPKDPAEHVEPPKQMHISHISGHFNTFIAYSPATGPSSTSVVLIGKVDSSPDAMPDIPPALQNRDVIAVCIGDYHYGALTSTGKLVTWGSYSRGALGLGDPREIPAGAPGGYAEERQRLAAIDGRRPTPANVNVPSEVRFDHAARKQGRARERFCFHAAAAGWHFGALVIDLDPDDEAVSETPQLIEDQELDPENLPGGSCFPLPSQTPGSSP
ncbi:RCC1/BLIP-II [Punctularia strigosozonata HHB-11173 SS5]|uniref:RCC1/BLIP-II n=1 Tax=Punctularia strigosozonata (strain HHB-11173) TaxID=741275 RepID=UPI0004416B07|nr:RCC1/BLIP-II [Punctularia strigosozonata HHB-11173 SS5]EIN09593.1 RCC1/BLIP-II [Punctularia strigosozonata HHB-11173 SS5]